jgi:hypothetical protein
MSGLIRDIQQQREERVTLIERLEAAREGSAKLDREILWATLHEDQKFVSNGSRMVIGHWHMSGGPIPLNLAQVPDVRERQWSRSLDVAVTLVPKGLEWEVNNLRTPNGHGAEATVFLKPFWEADTYDREARVVVEAATPALALCIAALKARGPR